MGDRGNLLDSTETSARGSAKAQRVGGKFKREGRQSSLVTQTLQRLSAMQETLVLSLGWEDPLEKEMAAQSSTLAWKIPRMEEPDGL